MKRTILFAFVLALTALAVNAYVTVPDPIIVNVDERGHITVIDTPVNGAEPKLLIETDSADDAATVVKATILKAQSKVK